MMVFNSLFLFVLFNGNFCSPFIQFFNVAILCLLGWHEVLFNVMSVAVGFLYMSVLSSLFIFDVQVKV
jgi:hypothetical protein